MDEDNEYSWIDQALIDQYEWSCQIEDFDWEVRDEAEEE